MKLHLPLVAAGIVLAVAACRPGPAEYSESEAPIRLTLDTVYSPVAVRFAPGSARMAPADVRRLEALAARGALGPADRVTVAAAGTPQLAAARVTAVSAVLLHYGVVASVDPVADLRRDQALISVRRDVVSLPNCPNWSKPASADFTNALSSNYGCATTVNLGRMVAYPSDLAGVRTHGSADAVTATAAVERYYKGQVLLPASATIGPITAPASQGGTGGAGATTTGTQ